MMAAITAAREGCQVTLYEKKPRIGQKILATGNGKCNLSNRNTDYRNVYNSSKYKGIAETLHKFTADDTINFFSDIGVLIREKNGYLYPYSEQAQTVLEAFRLELSRLDVEVICENEIETIEQKEDFFLVSDEKYDKVIIACGSKAGVKEGHGDSGYKIAEMMGHTLKEVVPGLTKLFCEEEELLKILAGVRCQAEVTMITDGAEFQFERGELQFTKNALSGIPIFQMSREVAYDLTKGKEVLIRINFFPDKTAYEFQAICDQRLNRVGETKSVMDFLLGLANNKVNQAIIKTNDMKQNDDIIAYRKTKLKKLLKSYRDFRFTVLRPDSFENAQVCAGGVLLSELSENLESLKVPGIYFAGEILDVDGMCGGFNLQWAWTTGYVAGKSAAEAGEIDD